MIKTISLVVYTHTHTNGVEKSPAKNAAAQAGQLVGGSFQQPWMDDSKVVTYCSPGASNGSCFKIRHPIMRGKSEMWLQKKNANCRMFECMWRSLCLCAPSLFLDHSWIIALSSSNHVSWICPFMNVCPFFKIELQKLHKGKRWVLGLTKNPRFSSGDWTVWPLFKQRIHTWTPGMVSLLESVSCWLILYLCERVDEKWHQNACRKGESEIRLAASSFSLLPDGKLPWVMDLVEASPLIE